MPANTEKPPPKRAQPVTAKWTWGSVAGAAPGQGDEADTAIIDCQAIILTVECVDRFADGMSFRSLPLCQNSCAGGVALLMQSIQRRYVHVQTPRSIACSYHHVHQVPYIEEVLVNLRRERSRTGVVNIP